MKKQKADKKKRDFLKLCGLSTVPFLLPTIGLNAAPYLDIQNRKSKNTAHPVNFIYNGLMFSPQEYIEKLVEINQRNPIEPDFYGNGVETKTLGKNVGLKLLNQERKKVVFY